MKTHRRSNDRILFLLLPSLCSSIPLVGCSGSGEEVASDAGGGPGDNNSGDPDAAAGGGSQNLPDDDSSADGGAGPVSHGISPVLMSTSPQTGAVGVLPEATIEFTFSEPMDAQSTEAAYESQDLPADSVSFDWNEDGTVLTLTPNEPLPTATASEFKAELPLEFEIAFESTAESKSGEMLAEAVKLEFKTAVRTTLSLQRDDSRSAGLRSDGYEDSSLYAGDSPLDEIWVAVMTFAKDALPTDIIRFESAELSGTFTQYQDPFDVLGELNLYGATFMAATWSAIETDIAQEPLVAGIPGGETSVPGGETTPVEMNLDVRDYVASGHHGAFTIFPGFQFAFAFESVSVDAVANWVTFSDPTLEVVFLVP